MDREIISAYAVRLTLPSGRDRLSDADQEALSGLTVGHFLPILEDYQRAGGTFALLVSLSFAVLSARRPRVALLARCSQLREFMRRAVIVEICDLHPGIPRGLINETAAMMKPFVRVVTGTVRTTADVSVLYRETDLHGIAIDCRHTPFRIIGDVVRAARRRTRNVIVHDVPNDVSTDTLRNIQASHVTWMEET